MQSSLLPTILFGQYEATFGTLSDIIKLCPDAVWEGMVANHPFSESAFHALFFADLYLGESVEVVKEQAFHSQYAAVFAGYEELENRTPVQQYDRDFLLDYLCHCREKAKAVLQEAPPDSLEQKTGIEWHDLSNAEMHVYNIRHLQHHCAQLIMRIRLDSDIHIEWYRTGFDGIVGAE